MNLVRDTVLLHRHGKKKSHPPKSDGSAKQGMWQPCPTGLKSEKQHPKVDADFRQHACVACHLPALSDLDLLLTLSCP